MPLRLVFEHGRIRRFLYNQIPRDILISRMLKQVSRYLRREGIFLHASWRRLQAVYEDRRIENTVTVGYATGFAFNGIIKIRLRVLERTMPLPNDSDSSDESDSDNENIENHQPEEENGYRNRSDGAGRVIQRGNQHENRFGRQRHFGGNGNEARREQRVWKKNVPYLYDTVVTRELEWPTLTVQWMPDVTKTETSDMSVHRMIMGTHTSTDVQNHLMISKFSITTDTQEVDEAKWDADLEEFGGYGVGNPAKLEHEIRINHPGEVHRARYMPQNPIIIASRGPSDDVYIFDYTKHPSQPHDNKFRPQLQLKGHEGEGYGMSWNNIKEGHLITAGDDGMICHWDINANQRISGQITPQTKFKGHASNIEDVSFHTLHENVFGSVGNDKNLNLWDLRQPKPQLSAAGHDSSINCLSFNPFSEFIVATGSLDKTGALWDIRNMRKKMYTLRHHDDEVFQVEFSPHFETVLASSGSDNRVIVWDLSRIQDPSSSSSPKTESPPPEVLFVHAGHSGKVADFSWNPPAKSTGFGSFGSGVPAKPSSVFGGGVTAPTVPNVDDGMEDDSVVSGGGPGGFMSGLGNSGSTNTSSGNNPFAPKPSTTSTSNSSWLFGGGAKPQEQAQQKPSFSFASPSASQPAASTSTSSVFGAGPKFGSQPVFGSKPFGGGAASGSSGLSKNASIFGGAVSSSPNAPATGGFAQFATVQKTSSLFGGGATTQNQQANTSIFGGGAQTPAASSSSIFGGGSSANANEPSSFSSWR